MYKHVIVVDHPLQIRCELLAGTCLSFGKRHRISPSKTASLRHFFQDFNKKTPHDCLSLRVVLDEMMIALLRKESDREVLPLRGLVEVELAGGNLLLKMAETAPSGGDIGTLVVSVIVSDRGCIKRPHNGEGLCDKSCSEYYICNP